MRVDLEKIKKSDAKDLHRIMSFNAEAQTSVKSLEYWEKFAEYAEEHSETELSWLIKIKDVPIGFISLSRKSLYMNWAIKLQKDKWKEGDLTLSIYLSPEFKGKGIGEKALSLLPREGGRIFASTYSTNHAANNFFKKRGRLVGSGVADKSGRISNIYILERIEEKSLILTENKRSRK